MGTGPAAKSFQKSSQNCKMGHLLKKGGAFDGWHIRYVVLDKQAKVLHYYIKETDNFPRKTIDLSQVKLAKASEKEGKKDHAGFRLVGTKTSTKLLFISADRKTGDEWVTAIQAVQSALGNSNDGPGPEEPVGPDQHSGHQPQPPAPARARTDTTLVAGNGAAGGKVDATLVGKNAAGGGEDKTVVANKNGATAAAPPVPVSRKVPHLTMTPEDNSPFAKVERDVLGILKFGRLLPNTPNDPDFIGFPTRVVSRGHAEIWTVNGEFYIRDTKSQTGTFLNAVRLSESGKESKPFKLHDGDIVQFGVDYKGGGDVESKCVSMRIHLKMVDAPMAAPGGRKPGDSTLVMDSKISQEPTLTPRLQESTLIPKMQEPTLVPKGQDSTLIGGGNSANSAPAGKTGDGDTHTLVITKERKPAKK